MHAYSYKNENIIKMTKPPWTIFHPWVPFPTSIFKIISDILLEPFL